MKKFYIDDAHLVEQVDGNFFDIVHKLQTCDYVYQQKILIGPCSIPFSCDILRIFGPTVDIVRGENDPDTSHRLPRKMTFIGKYIDIPLLLCPYSYSYPKNLVLLSKGLKLIYEIHLSNDMRSKLFSFPSMNVCKGAYCINGTFEYGNVCVEDIGTFPLENIDENEGFL